MTNVDKQIIELTTSIARVASIQENTIKNVEKLSKDVEKMLDKVCSRDKCEALEEKVGKIETKLERTEQAYIGVLWKFSTTLAVGVFLFILAELGVKYVLP